LLIPKKESLVIQSTSLEQQSYTEAKSKTEAEGGEKKSAFAEITAKAKSAEEKNKNQPEVDVTALTANNNHDQDKQFAVTPVVVGKKVPQTNTKGLAAKKVTSDFFADFDMDDEPDEQEDETPKEPESRYAPKSSEDEDKKSNVAAPAKEVKVQVGSDGFVPMRSKEAIKKDQKDRENQSGNFGVAQQNFGKAKAISSKQFFGEEESVDKGEKDRRLGKFEGARSISSADYFERDEASLGESNLDASDIARKIASTAKADVSHVKELISDSGRKLSEWSSNFFSELNERYGT